MIELNDETLNRYLDGELNSEETAFLKKLLQNSKVYSEKYEALRKIHFELKNIKEDEVNLDFTSKIMLKISHKFKPKKADKYFIASVSSIFISIFLIIIGFTIGSLINSPEQISSSSQFLDILSSYFLDISNFFIKLFSGKNISVFGSIMSLIILISAYFFFENVKHSKKVLK